MPSNLIDLYNPPEPTPDEQVALGLINWNPDNYTVVGYYFEPQSMPNGKFCLKVSTVAYFKEDIQNEIVVDTAVLCNTAITKEVFAVVSTNAQAQVNREGYFETTVRNGGFNSSDIQFMDDVAFKFRKTFVGLHDLRFIAKNAEYISISGCLVDTGELIYYDGNQFVHVHENYFTFKFHRLSPMELDNIDGDMTTFYCNKLGKLKGCLDDYPVISVKKLNEEIRIIENKVPELGVPQIYTTKFRYNSNLKSADIPIDDFLKTPETAFSSPCPPRWDEW